VLENRVKLEDRFDGRSQIIHRRSNESIAPDNGSQEVKPFIRIGEQFTQVLLDPL
jgi:hypothetical protein